MTLEDRGGHKELDISTHKNGFIYIEAYNRKSGSVSIAFVLDTNSEKGIYTDGISVTRSGIYSDGKPIPGSDSKVIVSKYDGKILSGTFQMKVKFQSVPSNTNVFTPEIKMDITEGRFDIQLDN